MRAALLALSQRQRVLSAVSRAPAIPARFHYDRSVRELNAFLTGKIDERWRRRQAEPGRKPLDMLDMLLAGYAAREGDAGEPWNADAARLVSDELKTMLFAGHDTSSAMLTWTLHTLTKHPEHSPACRRRRRGVRRPLRDGAMPVRAAQRLDYVAPASRSAGFKSSDVTRKAVADDRFASTRWAGCLGMLHCSVAQDPKQWPEPDVFRPERFLDESQGSAWRWLPFVNGPRSCVGQHFSLLEAKIVLSLLTQRFDFTPEAGNSETRHRFNVPVGPRDRIGMRVRRRI